MEYKVKNEKGETIDAIAARYYGSSFGYVELILEANIFLAEQPVILPQGIVLGLPSVLKRPQSRVSLWS